MKQNMGKIVVGLVIATALLGLYKLYDLNKVGSPTSENRMENTKPATAQKTVAQKASTYKVQRGEGLWQVAQKELGDGMRWGEIAEANGLKKPYVLYVGQELKIPGKESEVVTEVESTFTLAQIAEHSTKDSCWMSIEGKVYDVTPFIAGGFHPGKLAILLGCGKDATELFNTRPMGSGTAHSKRAREMLPKYYIGELAK
jgi:cytochrome b involved in lipid metabolism